MERTGRRVSGYKLQTLKKLVVAFEMLRDISLGTVRDHFSKLSGNAV